MAILKEGKMTMEKWNSVVLPAVKSGDLKDVSSELPTSFLVVGQTMRALVQEGNKKFYCSAWLRDLKTGHQIVNIQEMQ